MNKFKNPSVSDLPKIESLPEPKEPVKEPVKEPIRDYPKDLGMTILNNGEKISKTDKVIASIGSIEELCSFIGIIKAEHFNANSERKFDISNSTKMLFFGHLTQIQESLLDINTSLGTSRKVSVRYDTTRFTSGEQRVKDLDQQIDSMKKYVDASNSSVVWPVNPKTSILSGSSVLEAHLHHARSLCRRAERQVLSSKNVLLNLIPEDIIVVYLNKLGDYFLTMAIHTLHLHSKEPMKRTGTKK